MLQSTATVLSVVRCHTLLNTVLIVLVRCKLGWKYSSPRSHFLCLLSRHNRGNQSHWQDVLTLWRLGANAINNNSSSVLLITNFVQSASSSFFSLVFILPLSLARVLHIHLVHAGLKSGRELTGLNLSVWRQPTFSILPTLPLCRWASDLTRLMQKIRVIWWMTENVSV